MSVSENFDRKFNKCMRGYNPEEVDAAVDALLRYCDELEDANREFEIANNDLIDDKSDLQSRISVLEAEKDALIKKNAELSSAMAKIENVYNGYREKFGEARDLVTNAKTSAAEILARANAKAEILAEEAAKKREAETKKLDVLIEKKRELIEQLDIVYNNFNSEIKVYLNKMIDNVDSFHVVPIMPEGLPERIPQIIDKEPLQSEDPFIEEVIEADNEDVECFTPEEEKSEIIEEKEEIEETPVRVQETLGPVWRDTKAEDRISQVGSIKSSLDEINQKVLKKKSTPHI